MNEKFSVISIFSGAGGLDIGFISEGFHVDIAIELDEMACKTYEANHSTTKVLNRDVSTVTGAELRKVIGNKPVILIGGPPCQSWSIMKADSDGIGGKRGLEDERGQLLFQYLRLCSELKPHAIVFENVANLVSGEHKRSFETFKNKLKKETGLELYYRVLNALDYGTGQSRERCILIGVKQGTPNPFQFLEKIDGPKTLQAALQNVPSSEYFRFSKGDAEVMKMIGEGECWNVLPPQDAYQKMRKHYRGLCRKCRTKFQGMNICPKCGSKDIENQKGVLTSYYRRLSWKKHSPTICTVMTTKAWGTLAHPTEQRGLSIREAARLQSFPDNYIFCGTIFDQIRQIGNAVPCNMGKAVAKALKQSLEQIKPTDMNELLKQIIVHPNRHSLSELEKDFIRAALKKTRNKESFPAKYEVYLQEIYQKISIHKQVTSKWILKREMKR